MTMPKKCSRGRKRSVTRAAACVALLASALSGPAAAEVLFDQVAPSKALGHGIPYTIYRPPGPLATGQRLPVLYLLHGLGDDERAWVRFGLAQQTLDALIGAGTIKPLIVVMPAAGLSWYVDNPDPGGSGLMATALTHDLVAHIDATEPTLACRAGRAIGGLSMGGYGALLYSMDNPRQYAAAFSMSGSIFHPLPVGIDTSAGRTMPMLNVAFGQPLDWRRFNAWNLFTKLPAYLADTERTPFYLVVGNKDFGGLITGNQAFQKALAAGGVDQALGILPGVHMWSFWSAQLGPALQWLDPHLSGHCPS